LLLSCVSLCVWPPISLILLFFFAGVVVVIVSFTHHRHRYLVNLPLSSLTRNPHPHFTLSSSHFLSTSRSHPQICDGIALFVSPSSSPSHPKNGGLTLKCLYVCFAECVILLRYPHGTDRTTSPCANIFTCRCLPSSFRLQSFSLFCRYWIRPVVPLERIQSLVPPPLA